MSMKAGARCAIAADSPNAGKPLIMTKNAGYNIFAHSRKASKPFSEAEPARLGIHVTLGLPKSAQIPYPAFFYFMTKEKI